MTYLNGQEILDEPIVTTDADATLSGTPKVTNFIDEETGNELWFKLYPDKV